MRILILLLLLGVTVPGFARDEAPEDTAGDILAVKVRDAGYACSSPSALERTREGAAEGQIVWLISCDGVRYRVTIHGDTGTSVVPLD